MLGKCSQGWQNFYGSWCCYQTLNSEADSSVTAAQYLNQVKSAAKNSGTSMPPYQRKSPFLFHCLFPPFTRTMIDRIKEKLHFEEQSYLLSLIPCTWKSNQRMTKYLHRYSQDSVGQGQQPSCPSQSANSWAAQQVPAKGRTSPPLPRAWQKPQQRRLVNSCDLAPKWHSFSCFLFYTLLRGSLTRRRNTQQWHLS